MIPHLTWNSTCFLVNGVPTPLISGEFHYFRVPKKDWRARLLLLKESGANAIATYIPWIIHEPEEGHILFDDIPERSLTDFLNLCTELNIMVIARPGPHSYSELCRSGLPLWLADEYPELVAHKAPGVPDKTCRISYLHPTFLAKARTFIRSVSEVIRPHLVTNGGCIVSVQADNEIGGIHIWNGYLDHNKEGMGIGVEDGHYVRFLQKKYGTVEQLNRHYGTAFEDFTRVLPDENTPKDGIGYRRFMTDYQNFYSVVMETYIRTLCGWFREDGLNVAYCTNAGTGSLIAFIRNLPKQNERDHFLLGVDHYYALFPSAGMCPTPEKIIRYIDSMDMLEALGMPPSVLELQSGSASCYPPILPENLLDFYMAHVAAGMKGSNYYIFTGGPNFADTGCNTDIYDYHAPISADGRIRPIYYAQKERNDFSNQNTWMLTATRSYDVQVGFSWEIMQDTVKPWQRFSRDGLAIRDYLYSLQLTLGLSARLFKFREIGEELDVTVPLIVASDGRMSREKQENLIRFVKAGGKLILTPVIPEYDEDFLPCTLLRDFLGVKESLRLEPDDSPVLLNDGTKVYEARSKYTFPGFDGTVIGEELSCRAPLIEHKAVEGGQVLLLGMTYGYSQFCQMDMLELCLRILGGERKVISDSRELMVTLFENGERATCFLLNQLAGALTVNLTVKANGKLHRLENVTVPPLTTLPIEL